MRKFLVENLIPVIIVSFITLVVIILITLGVSKNVYAATVIDKNWERVVNTEEYRWVSDSESSRFRYPTPPSGARNISKSTWIETKRIPAVTRTETYYTGSGENKRSHTRTVQVSPARTEYITHYKISYEIQRWVFDKTLKTFGGPSDEPEFHFFVEDETHRISNRSEKYSFTLVLDNKKKDVKKYSSSDFLLYGKITKNMQLVSTVNGFGIVTSIKTVDGVDISKFE